MLWVYVFGGIALAGLVMLISYGIWLAHKASDVLSEVAMVGERAAELADLMAQVRIPAAAMGPGFEDPRDGAAGRPRPRWATYDDHDAAIVASEERES